MTTKSSERRVRFAPPTRRLTAHHADAQKSGGPSARASHGARAKRRRNAAGAPPQAPQPRAQRRRSAARGASHRHTWRAEQTRPGAHRRRRRPSAPTARRQRERVLGDYQNKLRAAATAATATNTTARRALCATRHKRRARSRERAAATRASGAKKTTPSNNSHTATLAPHVRRCAAARNSSSRTAPTTDRHHARCLQQPLSPRLTRTLAQRNEASARTSASSGERLTATRDIQRQPIAACGRNIGRFGNIHKRQRAQPRRRTLRDRRVRHKAASKATKQTHTKRARERDVDV